MDQQWEQLRQRCLACRACSLAQERTQVVFGVGDPAAEVLLVGEALGANEDKQGGALCGPGREVAGRYAANDRPVP